MAGVYWRGADGNIWAKDSSGVKNMGALDDVQLQVLTTAGGVNRLGTQIADPNPPAPTTTEETIDTRLTGGGGGGSSFTDTSAARGTTQSSLTAVDEILGNKLSQAEQEYLGLVGQYDTEAIENEGAYNKNREANESTREAQQQAALLAAANGGKGLYSVLSSLGANSGTGRLLANRAVSNEANIDIGDANKTFDTNATNLFDSYGRLKKEEEQRKNDAKSIYEKTQQSLRHDADTTRQGLWKDMASLWTQAGNNSEAANAMARASELNASLMRNSRPTGVPSYAKTPLSFQAPALESYLAGANDMTVKTAGASSGLPINGAIYTSTKKREKDL